jgi:sulfite oxidase
MKEPAPEMPCGKHASFVLHSRDPLNGGPPLCQLDQADLTAAELFFVRSHGTLPNVDPAGYRLEIGGMVNRPLSLTLGELRERFPRAELAATIECAGNRRDELLAVEPIPGELPWGAEAIGTAAWAGVPLRDVLRAAGVAPGAAHVAFAGLDLVERQGRRFSFGGSIPIEKGLAPEVLLAYEMNGAPLPAAHGAPLRVVAPGYIGARSVKWLAAIHLQREPSDNYFQAHAYKLFPPGVHADTADWGAGLMLGELSLNAAICAPAAGARLPAGPIELHGYAFAGGGRCVERVDISADGGASWAPAELLGSRQRWAWRRWRAQIDLPAGRHQLVARAWDSAANTQPEQASQLWNFKGYMNNAWHRVVVEAE